MVERPTSSLPLVIALLLANPVVTYLATGSLLASAILPLGFGFCALWASGRGVMGRTVVFNLLAFVAVLISGEAVVRHVLTDVVVPNLYEQQDGYYFNRPNLDERFQEKEYDVRYLTNDEGFRIAEGMDPARSYETADWIMVGDSFTQGAQVEFEELYTTQIYRHFPTKIVANIGVSGLGLPEHYRLLADQIPKLNPEFVILQLCSFNDFMMVSESRFQLPNYLAERSALARLLLQSSLYLNPSELPLGRWVEPFYPDVASNRRHNIFYRESSVEKEADLANASAFLAEIADLVRSSGAELLVFLIPTKEQVRARFLSEVLREFQISESQVDMLAPNRFMAGISDSLGFSFIDLLQPFRDSSGEPFFEYDEHLTTYGHDLVAEEVSKALGSRFGVDEVEIVSDGYAGDRYPRPASAGMLAFHSPRDGNTELFLQAQGSPPSRLTYNDVDDAHLDVSLSRNQAVFTQGNASTLATRVMTMDLGSLVASPLWADKALCGAIPVFSKGATEIASAYWECGASKMPQIAITSLETGEVHTLTSGAAEAWRPEFSPNDRRIVFIEDVGGQFDLKLFDRDTGRSEPITTTPFDEWDPVFSRSDEIIYAARPQGDWDLFRLNLDAGAPEKLLETTGDEWDPVIHDSTLYFAGEYGIFRGIYRLKN